LFDGTTTIALTQSERHESNTTTPISSENFVRSTQGLHPYGGDYVLKFRTV